VAQPLIGAAVRTTSLGALLVKEVKC
jgi:hypothetical protein